MGSVSIVAALLGWSKLPTWLQELILILVLCALAAGAVWYWHHRTLETGITQGIAQVRQADADATKKVMADAAKQSAENVAVANQAAQDAQNEITQLHLYMDAHSHDADSLCQQTTNDRSSGMPESGPAVAGTTRSRPTAPVVQSVPTGNPINPKPTQRQLLRALAAVADTQSATLREFQTRASPP